MKDHFVSDSAFGIAVKFGREWESVVPRKSVSVRFERPLVGSFWIELWDGPVDTKELVDVRSISRLCSYKTKPGLLNRIRKIQIVETTPECVEYLKWIFDGMYKDLDDRVNRRTREIEEWKQGKEGGR